MKKLAMAVTLICALSTSIFAGNMPTVGVADPPPPPTTATTSSTSSSLLVTVIVTVLSLR